VRTFTGERVMRDIVYGLAILAYCTVTVAIVTSAPLIITVMWFGVTWLAFLRFERRAR
jgi:hypothetical protein